MKEKKEKESIKKPQPKPNEKLSDFDKAIKKALEFKPKKNKK